MDHSMEEPLPQTGRLNMQDSALAQPAAFLHAAFVESARNLRAAAGLDLRETHPMDHSIERFVLSNNRIEIGVQVGEPGGGSDFMLLELQSEHGPAPPATGPSLAEQYALLAGRRAPRRSRKRTLQSRDENSNQGQGGEVATNKPKGICQFGDCSQEVNSRAKWCPEHSTAKRCTYEGPEGVCMRVARGSDPHCITHGGGGGADCRGVTREFGCTKSAEGKSEYCHTHGGGTRCTMEGCNKAARGATGLCISHGGGKRCQHPDCPKGAEGKTDYCISHGGGVRCSFEGCVKSARGRADFCIAHGGGIRCAVENCRKSAQGSTPLCIAHGGGARCKIEHCNKGARGSSGLCVGHGGGRRCAFEDCNRGAEGRTGLCIGHGGGHRCQHEGCQKPTRNREEYCKNHRDQRLVEGVLHRIRNSHAVRLPDTPSGASDYGEGFHPGPPAPPVLLALGGHSQNGTPTSGPGRYEAGMEQQAQWPAVAPGAAVGEQYVPASAYGLRGNPDVRNYEHVGSEFIQENQAYVVGEHEYVPLSLRENGFRPDSARRADASPSGTAPQTWSQGAVGAQLAGEKDGVPKRVEMEVRGGVFEGRENTEAPPVGRSFVDQSLGLGAAPPIVIPSVAAGAAGSAERGSEVAPPMVAPPIVLGQQASVEGEVPPEVS
ncbi:hypothetical protein KFL_000640210 [Klebsormidium nitens]|uniref:WRKY19-like zinc finger domain-containing protein n=1 Tax=Klebsormidium nitens TaxID=105231 RepID=A0A1Y1HQE2_KLENI|nr:hypothetical protein KFL_000640210 [Klebsormidium nitens]|eukprot:GAQ80854.1 hypothetical protein KFL_000640210 [Klebsormidium nitens]